MYICMDCNRIFDEPKIVSERHPYGMGYATEKLAMCPHCSGLNFEKALMCKNCGECTAELTDGLCGSCYEDIYGGEQV